MKKILVTLVFVVGFCFCANGQSLTSNELEKLHKKNPSAVRVYHDRINELDRIINECDAEIEWIKTERAINTGDNDGKSADIQKARKMEAVDKRKKQAQKDLQSAYRYYRNLANQ